MEFAISRLLSSSWGLSMGSANIPLRRHGLSHVETYDVTADELDRIESEGRDVGFDFQVALFCLTLAASFFVSLLLSPPPADKPKTFIVIAVIVVVGFLLGVIFLIKWLRSKKALSLTLRRIRERQVGPVGEEGKELKPSDLANLPSVEPGIGAGPR